MVKRIYATKLMGFSDDDIRRLEFAEQERVMLEIERLAQERGVKFDEVLREAEETGERVLRWGLDAELRRVAQDLGISEKEARERYEHSTQT